MGWGGWVERQCPVFNLNFGWIWAPSCHPSHKTPAIAGIGPSKATMELRVYKAANSSSQEAR